ncbi:hypothetical protein BaRGS_00002854 [Batillaria attramentaria]|uniref:Uncharacterized protein n=1 Tax=Batillaria attramentaria TaxID=370345 RepID=A0ABD0M364_9CAEN
MPATILVNKHRQTSLLSGCFRSQPPDCAGWIAVCVCAAVNKTRIATREDSQPAQPEENINNPAVPTTQSNRSDPAVQSLTSGHKFIMKPAPPLVNDRRMSQHFQKQRWRRETRPEKVRQAEYKNITSSLMLKSVF